MWCAAHDAHNSFKWALWFQFEDKNLLRDAYIIVESLRNSMNLLNKYMHAWIASRLSYAADMTSDKLEERQT